MDKQIFIINGSGGVGKDTFVEMVDDNSYKIISNDKKAWIESYRIENYSSVSKVKKIAEIIGWNGAKTEKDRKFLSDLKLLTTEYNDMPLNDMKRFARCFMDDDEYETYDGKILFLHIREPEEIAKAVKAFEKYNVKTILVKRDSVKHITSNMADENVYNYIYDIVIENNGTLEDLDKKARQFMSDCINNSLKERY